MTQKGKGHKQYYAKNLVISILIHTLLFDDHGINLAWIIIRTEYVN